MKEIYNYICINCNCTEQFRILAVITWITANLNVKAVAICIEATDKV